MRTKKPRRKRSLYISMLILLIFASLIPIAGSVTAFLGNVWSRQEEQAESSACFFADQLFDSSSAAMNTVQSAAQYLVSNDEIRAAMSAEAGSSVDQELLSRTLGKMILYDSVWQASEIRSLYLFRWDGVTLSLYGSDKYDTQYRRIRAVYDQYRDFSSARTLVPGPGDSCYFVLNYNDFQTHETYGKIIFELDISSILSAQSLQEAYPSAAVVLSTTDGELLSNQSIFSDEDVAQAVRSGRPYSYESEDTLDGEKMFHRRQRTAGSDLYIDVYLPRSEITAPLYEMASVFISSLVVLLVLTGTLSVLCGKVLLDPIKNAADTMSRMADGDLSVRMKEQQFRETEQIASAFNNMADHLDELYQDAYEKGIRLRATEYQLLEAQINPHFIFNVLETINMRCLAAGHREISRIVTDLAELLRAGVRSRTRQKWTFSDELRYVQYYLDLQKARFQKALEYEIDYEDGSLLSYYLPKLTIQPLVENAVVHGLEPRQGGGRVSVKIWEEDESIYIRIEDNGVGFDPRQAPAPATMGSKHTHIALPNIRERLQLLYGDAAQLRISSVPDQGTVALLIIPIDEKEE